MCVGQRKFYPINRCIDKVARGLNAFVVFYFSVRKINAFFCHRVSFSSVTKILFFFFFTIPCLIRNWMRLQKTGESECRRIYQLKCPIHVVCVQHDLCVSLLIIICNDISLQMLSNQFPIKLHWTENWITITTRFLLPMDSTYICGAHRLWIGLPHDFLLNLSCSQSITMCNSTQSKIKSFSRPTCAWQQLT